MFPIRDVTRWPTTSRRLIHNSIFTFIDRVVAFRQKRQQQSVGLQLKSRTITIRQFKIIEIGWFVRWERYDKREKNVGRWLFRWRDGLQGCLERLDAGRKMVFVFNSCQILFPPLRLSFKDVSFLIPVEKKKRLSSCILSWIFVTPTLNQLTCLRDQEEPVCGVNYIWHIHAGKNQESAQSAEHSKVWCLSKWKDSFFSAFPFSLFILLEKKVSLTLSLPLSTHALLKEIRETLGSNRMGRVLFPFQRFVGSPCIEARRVWVSSSTATISLFF